MVIGLLTLFPSISVIARLSQSPAGDEANRQVSISGEDFPIFALYRPGSVGLVLKYVEIIMPLSQ